MSTDEFVEALLEEYDRVTAQVYGNGEEGRLALSNAHRAGLGLAPFSMDALAASDGTHALDVEAPPVSDAGARPRTLKRQGSVSVDAAYRAMPTHHTPTEFDAKGSSGQSAWAGMMPDAAAAPPTPVNRASKWPGWSKK